MTIIPFEQGAGRRRGEEVKLVHASLFHGDANAAYERWPEPDCIISDGPYGLGKYPGEPVSPDGLAEWYAPHAAAWAKRSKPSTTLWFWNSELGWAKSHAALELHGWQYEEAIVWDKGIAHIAGNVNSKTIRGVPVVTEICVRYTRKLTLVDHLGNPSEARVWLRSEWQRSGLPLSRSNEACGVANAATRKYLTQDHVWYFPPGEAVVAMAEYCRQHGASSDRPYFSLDGRNPVSEHAWNSLRAHWNHVHGQTNVWRAPPVHGRERVKAANAYLHANQKPLALLEKQILACTQEGDMIWEPFGGLCSASVAAVRNHRFSAAAEINPLFFNAALGRLRQETSAEARASRAAT